MITFFPLDFYGGFPLGRVASLSLPGEHLESSYEAKPLGLNEGVISPAHKCIKLEELGV